MSGFFSSLFGANNPNVPQTQQATQNQGPTQAPNPGQPMQGTQASPVTAPNGLVPTQNQQVTPQDQPAPFDAYKDVWNTKPDPNANKTVFADADPNKMMETARQVDFAKVLKPEQLQAISKGGPEAMEAFAQSLNSVAQTVYGQSAFATTKIVEQALARNKETTDKQMADMMKKFSTNEGLQASNPLLNNPAIKPIAEAITDQLIRKNPNATSSEIQTQVNDFFTAMGQNFAPKPASTQSSSSSRNDDFDWSKFLG